MTSLPQRIRHSTILTYGYMHIAFSVGSRTDVDKLTLRLTHDGYGLNTYPESIVLEIMKAAYLIRMEIL